MPNPSQEKKTNFLIGQFKGDLSTKVFNQKETQSAQGQVKTLWETPENRGLPEAKTPYSEPYGKLKNAVKGQFQSGSESPILFPTVFGMDEENSCFGLPETGIFLFRE